MSEAMDGDSRHVHREWLRTRFVVKYLRIAGVGELVHEPARILATHWGYRCSGIDRFLQSNQFCGGDSIESF
jgi:hypothetical protein